MVECLPFDPETVQAGQLLRHQRLLGLIALQGASHTAITLEVHKLAELEDQQSRQRHY